MNTVASPRPRVKPARKIKLVLAPTALMDGIVQITVGRSTVDYFVRPLPSDFGRGFTLIKLFGDDAYHVNVGREGRLCDCKGYFSAKGRSCKHADGMAALVAAGRI